MKFQINKTDLDKSISIAQKAISNRSSIQILEGIVFTAKNNELILTSTDLELSIETRVQCTVLEEGSRVIKSSIIGNIVKKMPNDIITFDFSDDTVNIRCQNSVFDISTQSSYDYPALPNIKEDVVLTMDNEDLINAIKETIFATSNDETRLAITGILFETKNNEQLRFVGLDGYRMAVKTYKYNSNKEVSAIVPKRAFNELSKILEKGNTDIVVIEGHIAFINENTKMYSRLIDKKYLDYNKIYTNNHSTEVVVNRNDLINSLDRALLLTSGAGASLTKLNIEDNVISINSNSEIGKLDEKVFCRQDGENIRIAFNTRYIIEGLKVMEDDEVILQLNSPLSPMNIYPANNIDEYLYLVLPVRLSN